jgi:5-methyltetrahydrofolate corrinoid/iron sulfur protein methyltransferase
MKFIGENIHIISKKTRTAIEERNKEFIQDLAIRQSASNMAWIDLNIGPARRGSEGVMNWLVSTILEVTDTRFSFDTSNITEMEHGFKSVSNPQDCIVNSASGDPDRLESMMTIASKYNSNIIALTMSNETGIPKDPDGRLEIASIIVDKAAELGVDNTKILLDPLVLPISVDQSQAMEALNSIRVFKESFDPQVLTTIGLSNVSNGSPRENRPLINRLFAVMAAGCGLDTAIIDAFDIELIRVINVAETGCPEKNFDKLYIDIYKMMQEFGDLEDISYNKDNPEEEAIYRTAKILMNKNIYAHNYLDENFAVK